MKRHHLPAPPLPAGRPLLVVTGFMGTGKTTSGAEASAMLRLPFVDLDEVVARRAGRSIPEIFGGEGEAAFRTLERAAVADAARLSGTVIATGGGAVLDEAGFAGLSRNAAVVVLTATADELARRLAGKGGRPLIDAADPGRLAALLDERSDAYARAGEAVDTTGRTTADVAAVLAARFRERVPGGAVRIDVAGPHGPYPVLVGAATLRTAGEEVRAALPDAELAVVVSDAAVGSGAAAQVAASLSDTGMRVERASVPAGEAGKSLGVVDDVWRRFVELGVDRTSAVVAVGGGAALDTAGFAAATFARGVPLVNVPTTLLAMADASLGGKTAIDHGGAKNSVGAFHHPRLVLADPDALASLPGRDLRAGLAEVVKMAATASPLALDVLEAMPLDADGIPADLAWIVEQAVRMKAAYVAEDAADLGLRHTLNLGHTVAHGIEGASAYAVPHGEAVAIGLLAETRFGESVAVTPEGTASRLEALLTRLGLPIAPPAGVDARAIAAAMGADKKRRAGRTVVVVPAPGGAELLEDVDPAAVLSFLPSEVRT
jgi:shikimate kinase / 3-dehydroquinate synthase